MTKTKTLAAALLLSLAGASIAHPSSGWTTTANQTDEKALIQLTAKDQHGYYRPRAVMVVFDGSDTQVVYFNSSGVSPLVSVPPGEIVTIIVREPRCADYDNYVNLQPGQTYTETVVMNCW